MEHLFYGEFELTVDDKNRLLVPSEVRKQLDPSRDGEAFFGVPGINGRLWLYPEKYYQTMVTREPGDVAPLEEMLAFDQASFALTHRLEWDKQGRVLLPEKLLKRLSLDKDVTMIGVRNHLELWNRNEWETRREELMQNISAIALKARNAKKTS